ncbi:MAG TPA: hypothetical protein VL691_08720 [Vicinamibacteria bacterium]|nr:hypothetical protein [Vicinamibacteria bacterium]
MLVIQLTAAGLLLLGSWLIFRALVEIDAPGRPRPMVGPRSRPAEPEVERHLPRAA